MGIELQSVRVLLAALDMGVDFGRTLTIGRQNMMLDESQAAGAFRDFRRTLSTADARAIAGAADPFSNALFKTLGADQVAAMDISDYEGASVIHDLNQPLPDALANQHSTVFDGGTLEHVFNCTTALASYMRLPEVGGHLIIGVPANNEMGHGFYQFSPEFFFRTLSADNGYRIRAMVLAPIFSDQPWLLARDPASVGARVGYNGWTRPTYIFVIAQRVADVALFGRPPQQSDYASEWELAAQGEIKRQAQVDVTARRGLAARARQTLRQMAPDTIVDLGRTIRDRARKPDPRSLLTIRPDAGAARRIDAFYLS